MTETRDPKVEVVVCGRRSIRANEVVHRPGSKFWLERSIAKSFEDRGLIKILNDPNAYIMAEKEAKKKAEEAEEDEDSESVVATTADGSVEKTASQKINLSPIEMRAALKAKGIVCPKRCKNSYLQKIYAETFGE